MRFCRNTLNCRRIDHTLKNNHGESLAVCTNHGLHNKQKGFKSRLPYILRCIQFGDSDCEGVTIGKFISFHEGKWYFSLN